MKIAVCEIGSHLHITYVESIVQVYASDKSNQVFALVPASEIQHLGLLRDLENVVLIPFENYEQALSELAILNGKMMDIFVFPTLEPVNKHNYSCLNYILHLNPDSRVYFGVHNVNIWFIQNKIKHFFQCVFSFQKLGEKIYKLKRLYYAGIAKRIYQQVREKNGAFIVISDAIRSELGNHVSEKEMVVIPFSVFNETYFRKFQHSVLSGKFSVVIPGMISAKRRDYLGFLKAMRQYTTGPLKQKLVIDLLGKMHVQEGGEEVAELAETLNADGFAVKWHTGFIPMEEFDAALAFCNMVGGILNVQLDSGSVYGKTKESGIVYTMIKLAKPGFLPVEYALPGELTTSVISYADYASLFAQLAELMQDEGKLSALQAAALENSRKFTPEKVLMGLQAQLSG